MQAPFESHRIRLSCLAVLLGAALSFAPGFAAAQAEAGGDAPLAVKTAAGKKTAKAKPKGGSKAGAKSASTKKAGKKPSTAKKEVEDKTPGTLAEFGKAEAPADVVHVANWVSYTRNNKKKAFVLIDKKQARMYVFDPRGKLKSDSPILLGKAVGDDAVPGIGSKPMSQMKEEEKTTPAGKFLAAPGRNTYGEDIIWIDYNNAISMHRLRKVSAEQRRAERMNTPQVDDNRISYGCVNVPHKFYNSVLRPTVAKQGAFVYVLPETRSPQQQFGSFDVRPDKVAEAPSARTAK
jgi:hypothetical protein